MPPSSDVMEWRSQEYSKSLPGVQFHIQEDVPAQLKISEIICWNSTNSLMMHACGSAEHALNNTAIGRGSKQYVAAVLPAAAKVGRLRWQTAEASWGAVDVSVLVSTDPVSTLASHRSWQSVDQLGNGFQGAEASFDATNSSALGQGKLEGLSQIPGSWHSLTFLPVEGVTAVALYWHAPGVSSRLGIDTLQLWTLPIVARSSVENICGNTHPHDVSQGISMSTIGVDYAKTIETALMVEFNGGLHSIDRIAFGSDYSSVCGNCTSAASAFALQYTASKVVSANAAWKTLGFFARDAGDMRRIMVSFDVVQATGVRLVLGSPGRAPSAEQPPVLIDEIEVYEVESWRMDSCWSTSTVVPIVQMLPDNDEEVLFTPQKCVQACDGYNYAGIVNKFAGSESKDESSFECRCKPFEDGQDS
jgi:hypothetical protein